MSRVVRKLPFDWDPLEIKLISAFFSRNRVHGLIKTIWCSSTIWSIQCFSCFITFTAWAVRDNTCIVAVIRIASNICGHQLLFEVTHMVTLDVWIRLLLLHAPLCWRCSSWRISQPLAGLQTQRRSTPQLQCMLGHPQRSGIQRSSWVPAPDREW